MNARKPLRIFITVIIYLFALTTVLPLLWMLSTSLKFESDVFNFPIEWFPKRFNAAANFFSVWVENKLVVYYWNTIQVTILTTISQVTVSALGAYAFSKIEFRFRDQLFLLYLLTLMIPAQMTIIPTFMIFRWLHLIDTHLGLVLVGSFSVYGTFLLRQYMIGIPMELSEAARIDGAGHFYIFRKLLVPLCQPAIVTLVVLKFIWVWNDYQNPLIFLNSQRLFTLQIAIQSFQSEYGRFYALMMTAAVSAILPLIVLYMIAQRYVIEGISAGALKG